MLGLFTVSGWSQDDLLDEAVLELEGMTCGSCAESIAVALGAIEGVRNATADFDSALARVSYDPQVTSPEALIAAVNEIGLTWQPLVLESVVHSLAAARGSGRSVTAGLVAPGAGAGAA